MRTWRIVLTLSVIALWGAIVVTGPMWASAQGPASSGNSNAIPADDDTACLSCHGPLGMFGRTGKFVVEERHVKGSVHKDLTCTSCHSSITQYPHVKEETAQKVDCLTCHEESVRETSMPRPDPPGLFAKSVHGTKLAQNVTDVPTCLSCHGPNPHTLKSPRTWDKKLQADKCAACHADKEIMDRHGVPVEAATSYFTSFHGKAIKYGSQETATCTDCHNAHYVLPPNDPNSSTSAANIQATCNHCHQGAPKNFAMAGTGHLDLTLKNNRVLWLTNFFFVSLAAFVFTMLGVFMILDIRRRIRDRRLGVTKYSRSENPRKLKRWTFTQSAQHGVLMVSIVTLILTGFPLRFPDAPGMRDIYMSLGGIEVARVAHRAGAIGLIGVAIWHILYLLVRWYRHRTPIHKWPMLPKPKDLMDMIHTIQYYLGHKKDPAKFHRYSYREKLDYLAEYWGVPIMVLSGLVLWFPAVFADRLPGIVVAMAYVAHGIEATIAACVILSWHMYNVLFAEGVLGNRAWLTGYVTEDYLKHKHALEYEEHHATPEERAAQASAEPDAPTSAEGTEEPSGGAEGEPKPD